MKVFKSLLIIETATYVVKFSTYALKLNYTIHLVWIGICVNCGIHIFHCGFFLCEFKAIFLDIYLFS